MPAPSVVKKKEEPVIPEPPPSKAVGGKDEDTAANNSKEFTITLRKTPENSRLGLTVDIANSVNMVVDKVNGGLLSSWNQSHPDMGVKPGDRVVTVNGQSGDAVELTQVC